MSTSTQAAIEMNDASAEPPVAATVLVSLYQQNLWGVRVVRWLSYLRAQTGAVSYKATSY